MDNPRLQKTVEGNDYVFTSHLLDTTESRKEKLDPKKAALGSKEREEVGVKRNGQPPLPKNESRYLFESPKSEDCSNYRFDQLSKGPLVDDDKKDMKYECLDDLNKAAEKEKRKGKGKGKMSPAESAEEQKKVENSPITCREKGSRRQQMDSVTEMQVGRPVTPRCSSSVRWREGGREESGLHRRVAEDTRRLSRTVLFLSLSLVLSLGVIAALSATIFVITWK